jgi:hypothetical protein
MNPQPVNVIRDEMLDSVHAIQQYTRGLSRTETLTAFGEAGSL